MGKKSNAKPQSPQRLGKSPWTIKPRTVSRQEFLRVARKPFAFFQLPRLVLDARAIIERGLANVPDSEKKDFLENHEKFAVKAMISDDLRQSLLNRKISQGLLDKIGSKTLNYLVNKTCEAIAKAEAHNLGQKVSKHVLGYFEARKIPVKTKSEKAAFYWAIDGFFAEKGTKSAIKPLDLAWIEREYLARKKGFRGAEQDEAAQINSIAAKIFGRGSLTKNQRKAAKNWIKQNLPALTNEKRKIMKETREKQGGFTANCIIKMLEESSAAEKRFEQSARTELLKTFRPPEKRPGIAQAIVQTGPVKGGTRAERMAAYQPTEKSIGQRTAELTQQVQLARSAGQKFDSVSYALAQIKVENPQTAVFLAELQSKRLLSGDSATKLFISGSLAQRLFRIVANDAEFNSRFGNAQLDLLARGLSFIGSQGRQTERAKKAFQGPKRKELFEFLEKRGFIDTEHGKGNVVTYLSRRAW